MKHALWRRVLKSMDRNSMRSFAIATLALVFFVAVANLGFDSERSPIASSETNFVERSPSGLQIVPASCDSVPVYEHWAGQCTTGTPPEPPFMGCSMVAFPAAISSGSTQLNWIINPATAQNMSISPSVGSVGPSGSATVSPTQTTTYTLSGEYPALCESPGKGGAPGCGPRTPFSCSATVTVASCANGLNISQYPSCTCPSGYTQQGATCVVTGCPTGYTLQGGSCVFTGCPSGYVQQGNQCVVQGCGATYMCIGSGLYYQNASCQQSLVQNCTYGCSAGACLPPPSMQFITFVGIGRGGSGDTFNASGHLQVRPTLVRAGETTQVYWNVNNVSSCTVSGTNGDSWSGGFSGESGKTSGVIPGQTIYTLSCSALPGATPASITEKQTVNVVPVFNEH